MDRLELGLPSRRAVRKLGVLLASALAPADLVLLSGPLGAGKTFFARGVLRSLGVPARVAVTSPTFALVQEYDARLPVLHADLYRLTDEQELGPLGLAEARAQGRVLLVEWGDPYLQALGGDALHVALSVPPAGSGRRAELRSSGARSGALLADVRQHRATLES